LKKSPDGASEYFFDALSYQSLLVTALLAECEREEMRVANCKADRHKSAISYSFLSGAAFAFYRVEDGVKG
jgi:hypothetical protein